MYNVHDSRCVYIMFRNTLRLKKSNIIEEEKDRLNTREDTMMQSACKNNQIRSIKNHNVNNNSIQCMDSSLHNMASIVRLPFMLTQNYTCV